MSELKLDCLERCRDCPIIRANLTAINFIMSSDRLTPSQKNEALRIPKDSMEVIGMIAMNCSGPIEDSGVIYCASEGVYDMAKETLEAITVGEDEDEENIDQDVIDTIMRFADESGDEISPELKRVIKKSRKNPEIIVIDGEDDGISRTVWLREENKQEDTTKPKKKKK